MLSIWEKRSLLTYEYIVIGSGITGLTAAISICEQQKGASVLVLESGILPSGASTKNAGFACFGSLTELLADSEVMGTERLAGLVHQRWRGLQHLRQRMGDLAIGYEQAGGYELLSEQQLPALARLEEVNDWLRPVFRRGVFRQVSERIAPYGFNPELACALVYNPFEGILDTGMMMDALLRRAYQLGIRILTGCQVANLVQESEGVLVQTAQERLAFRSQKVGIATNAFATALLPELDISPGRGQVLVTDPLGSLPWKGAFHFDEGYYYFRNLGSRILFGGGRNTDFEEETTHQPGLNPGIQARLEEWLRTLIIPGKDFTVAHRWSGIMGFGAEKKPLIGLHTPDIGYSVRMGGMGVALGSLAGEKLAALLLGEA